MTKQYSVPIILIETKLKRNSDEVRDMLGKGTTGGCPLQTTLTEGIEVKLGGETYKCASGCYMVNAPICYLERPSTKSSRRQTVVYHPKVEIKELCPVYIATLATLEKMALKT